MDAVHESCGHVLGAAGGVDESPLGCPRGETAVRLFFVLGLRFCVCLSTRGGGGGGALLKERGSGRGSTQPRERTKGCFE